MADTSKALLPGTYVSGASRDYRVVKVLGAGGFGITYLVESVETAGEGSVPLYFAMKELFVMSRCQRVPGTTNMVYSASAKDTVENALNDFIVEANRLRSLGERHPSIVSVHEVFNANNTAYYVMEFLPGTSLRQYVESRGYLTPTETKAIIAPIADAVAFLHANRLTHMDIKPDNIMLTPAADASLSAVLIDFGLSKHYTESGAPTTSVKTQGCSDGFSPMEQYGGIDDFQPTADIYALGATMMFCLTGMAPRKATDIVAGEVASILSPVPGSMPALVTKMMAFSRVDRPQDMNEVISELNSPDIDSPYVLSPAGGMVPPQYPQYPQQYPQSQPVAPSRSHTARNIVIAAVAAVVVIALVACVWNLFSGPSRHDYYGAETFFNEYTTTSPSHSSHETAPRSEVLSATLSWNGNVDLDLFAVQPNGTLIHCANRFDATTGAYMGEDARGGGRNTERIVWNRPVDGYYDFFIRTVGSHPENCTATLSIYANGCTDVYRVKLKPLIHDDFEPEYFRVAEFNLENSL